MRGYHKFPPTGNETPNVLLGHLADKGRRRIHRACDRRPTVPVRGGGGRCRYGTPMELLDGMDGFRQTLDTPMGIVLLVVGAFVALKAAKFVVKLAMLPVVLGGLYLWFGA